MRACPVLTIITVATASVLLWRPAHQAATRRAQGPLPHQFYVWQRSWNDAIRTAIPQASQARPERLVLLAAEVTWEGQRTKTTHASIDYHFLEEHGIEAGLALRVGAFRGDFSPAAEPARGLAALARNIVNQAESAGVHVREFQIDFDCPESKLRGYRQWVSAIRDAVAPVPVTITALPAWLEAPGFRELLASCDGYVLQVHSLDRPRSIDAPLTLCDPRAARTAVERAARFGVGFRVALPTYGYAVGFDATGQFMGLQAEGPSLHWPPGTRIRMVRADAPALAQLVRDWTDDRPQAMQGIIWYRLPVPTDRINWTWPTLLSVMAGKTPHARIEAAIGRPETRLVELKLTNSGDGAGTFPASVTINSRQNRVLAADGQSGFEVTTSNPPTGGVATFSPATMLQDATIAPGETKQIGWLRLEHDTEVEVHVFWNSPTSSLPGRVLDDRHPPAGNGPHPRLRTVFPQPDTHPGR